MTPAAATAGARVDPRMADRAPEVGLAAFVATVTMLFTAFTAAYLIRRTSLDFAPVRLPSLVWVGAVVLVACSAALERARGSRAWLRGALGLGLAFVATQVLAWRELASMGVFLGTSPHASFFYILTGLHGAHVIGGLGAIAYLLVTGAGRVDLAAWYWHFLGAIWIYLLLLLSFF